VRRAGLLPESACEGVDALAREGEGLNRLWEALLELDSSESERFEGGRRDGPAMLVAEDEEDEAEVEGL
jgi:hypothetical protein